MRASRRALVLVGFLVLSSGRLAAQQVYTADPPDAISQTLAQLKKGNDREKSVAALAGRDDAAPYLRAELSRTTDPLDRRGLVSAIEAIEARAYARNVKRAESWVKGRQFDLYAEFASSCRKSDAAALAELAIAGQKDIFAEASKLLGKELGFPGGVGAFAFPTLKNIPYDHYADESLTLSNSLGIASVIQAVDCGLKMRSRDNVVMTVRDAVNDMAEIKGGDWSGCLVFVNNSTVPVTIGQGRYLLVVCDGDVEFTAFPRLYDCVIVSNGTIQGREAGPIAVRTCVLSATRDIHLPAYSDNDNCLLQAGGTAKVRKNGPTVRENQKEPPLGIRFLSPKDFGLDVAVQNGGVQVMGVTPDSPFAKFGVADADVIVTIDDVRADSLPAFRRQLRRGVLKESVTLGIRRGNERLTRIVFLEGVPEPARPVAPPPREVRP
jgi:hypothetical protein